MSVSAKSDFAPVEKIHVKANVRKVFDKTQLNELAENIGRVGVLEPLLVRENGTAGYELIAGERRLRAAKLAKLEQVPIRILDVDDKTALEIQAFENLHRQDLTPVEEARAFKLLLDAGRHTVETLAERCNKSVRHVYRAMALLSLPEEALDAIDNGKLTPAHGHQLLRVPEKQRASMAKSAIRNQSTARELAEQIDRHLGHDLTKAAFPKDRPFAGKVACVGCPLNSDNQQDLLGETVKGRCTGADCYKVKADAYIATFMEEQKEKFAGVKFVGTVDQDYNANVPGLIKLPSSAPVLAQVKKDPSAFRAVVVRKRDWNDDRPTVLLFGKATKDVKKAAGMANTPSTSRGSVGGERPSRMQAIGDLINAAEKKVIWDFTNVPSAYQIRDLIAERYDDDELCQILQITPAALKKFNQQEMFRALYFVYGNHGDSISKGVKLNRGLIEKKVNEAAAAVWPKSQSPACKTCGCTPMKACSIDKRGFGRRCWWVEPGVCSACQIKKEAAGNR